MQGNYKWLELMLDFCCIKLCALYTEMFTLTGNIVLHKVRVSHIS